MNKILLIFLILTNIILAQENYEVTDVTFMGNETIDDEEISDIIAFTSTGWFSKTILRDEPFLFNSSILDADILNIAKLYQREGFLFTEVNAETMIDDENESVDVVFRIDEGPPVIVDSVSIQQNESLSKGRTDLDSLMLSAYRDLLLIRGKRFRDDDIQTDKTRIIGHYINNGYPRVKVNFDLKVDTINCLVSIGWHIDTGEFSKFGETSIDGLNHYPENLIRSKLNFTSGEIYNSEKLEETQARLYDLGIFYSVNFKSLLNTSPIDIVPVQLNLTEAKRLKTTIGVGYGRDEKFRYGLELNFLGFLRGPGRISFEAKRSAIERFSFRLGYILPEFLWERTTLRLNTFASRLEEIPYKEDSRGFNIGVLKGFSKYFFAAIIYSFENVDLDVNSIAIQDDSTQLKENYNKSGIGLTFRVTTAEPISSPQKGFSISLSTTYSGLGLGSPYKFFKSIIDIRKYNLIFDSMITGLRFSIGYLQSFNSPEFIPIEERFYLGGSSSVRGWERFRLSPYDINGKPKGGSSFLQGSIELRYPALEEIYGVLFLDYGNVWEPSLTYKIDELQYALGIGLRYDTAIGPLSIDLARPIFNENKKLQLWFNVGHAF